MLFRSRSSLPLRKKQSAGPLAAYHRMVASLAAAHPSAVAQKLHKLSGAVVAIKNFKKATLMVAGSAAQKLMMSLAKEQEILMGIADMAVWAYTAESLVLRAQKIAAKQGAEAAALPTDMMQRRLGWPVLGKTNAENMKILDWMEKVTEKVWRERYGERGARGKQSKEDIDLKEEGEEGREDVV